MGPVGRGIVYPITVDPQLLDTTLTVSLSGSLYPTSQGQYAPQLIGDAPLQLNVTVGQSSGDPPPYQVSIQVDGGSPVPQGTISSGGTLCPAPPTSCLSGTANWTFYPEQYGAGAHTITVTADDWAYPQGFSAPTTFTVYVNHSAQASVGPGSVNLTSGELSLGATDVSLSGSGNELTVQRDYRSREGVAGPLGPGWGLSVPAGQAGGDFASLQPQPNGNVLATESSGFQDTFTADTNGDGGFTSPPRFAGVQLSKTSAADGQIGEYPTRTSAASPYGIAAGPDGAVWFTENAANKIGRIAPQTAADSAGGNYTLSANGVVATGKAGPISGTSAVAFTGSSSLQTTQTPLNATTSWTLEGWIDPANLNQNGMAVFAGDEGGQGGPADGYGFGITSKSYGDSNGGCLMGLFEGGAGGWIPSNYCFPNANQWYYVAMTYAYSNGSGTVNFYVGPQGGSVSSVATVARNTPPTTPSGLFIGGYNGTLYGGSAQRYFDGNVSNVAVYPTALASTSITSHFNAMTSQNLYATTVLGDQPVAYYKLNDASTTTEYAVPSDPGRPGSPGPENIALGPDGNLWFTENGNSDIGEINPQTDAVSYYEIPTGTATPVGIAAGPAGSNTMWFTEFNGNKIGEFNVNTPGTINEYSLGAGAGPGQITLGPNGGNMWFTEWGASKIGEIVASGQNMGQITLFPTPTPNAAPTAITAGSDGALWFTENLVPDQIGRIATNSVPNAGQTNYQPATVNGNTYGVQAQSSGYVANGTAGAIPGSGSVTFKGASSIYETSTTPVTQTTGWTLEAWINPSSASQTGMVIYDGDEGGQGGAANGYGFGLFGASNGNSAGDCLDGLFEGVTWIYSGYCSFQPGQWYFVAETCNAGPQCTFYVDGTAITPATQPTSLPFAPTGGMMIGGYNAQLASYGGSGPRYFSGQISDAAFYGPQSSGAPQISAQFDARTSQGTYDQAIAPTGGPDPGAYFRLNDAAQINEYAIPNGAGDALAIAGGADGDVWFTDGLSSGGNQVNQLVKVSPTATVSAGTLSATEYSTPTNGWPLQGITAGPDGAMWFTENGTSQIGRITLGGYQLRDLAGDATTFTTSGSNGEYLPTLMTQPGGANQTTIDYTSIGGQAVPLYAITAAAGDTAISNPQTCIAAGQAGCRMLTFRYGAQNGGQSGGCTANNGGGDIFGQLAEVDFTAYDPSKSAMNTIPVACYQYYTSGGSTGLLQGEWDPRTQVTGNSHGLETTYAYNANNKLQTLTPPGLNPWTFNYFTSAAQSPLSDDGVSDANFAGSLQSVTRTLGSTPSTWTIVYNVPIAQGGAPYSFLSAGEWDETDLPKEEGQYNGTGATAIFPPDEVPQTIPPTVYPSDYHRATVDYLDSAGNEVNVLSPSARVNAYTTGLPSGTKPTGVTDGPDGNVWVADQEGAIEKVNPAACLASSSGCITSYTTGLNAGSKPTAIALGADGNLWFTDQGSTPAIGKINPSSGAITEYSTGSGSMPTSIVSGPGDYSIGSVMWFTDPAKHALGEINSGGTITEHTSDIGLSASNTPYGIALGRDGNIWFTDTATNKLGRLLINAMAVTETSAGLPGAATPTALTSSGDGDLWFTDPGTDAVGKFNPTSYTSNATETTIPAAPGTSSVPLAITEGADGNVWFTYSDGASNIVGKITPSGTFTADSLLTVSAVPAGIVGGPDGAAWVTESAGQQILRLPTSGDQSSLSTTQYGYNPTDTSNCTPTSFGPNGCPSLPTVDDPVFQLSANNLNEAMAASQPATLAGLLSTLSYYSIDGTQLQRVIGPQHTIAVPNGNNPPTVEAARPDTVYTYNCANATGGSGSDSCGTGVNAPSGGGPYALVTETQAGALPATYYTGSNAPSSWFSLVAAQAPSNDVDVRTTTRSYSSAAQGLLGWTLREPLAVTVDPNGLALTHTTFYDPTTGQPIETVQPKDPSPAGPNHGDASAAQTYYYTSGSSSIAPNFCQNTPQYAGLVCETTPAAQPTDSATQGHSASMPSLPVTGGAYSSSGISAGVAYNIWDEPTTTVQAVWDSSGNQATRTTTAIYDAAGRPSTSAIAATGSNTGQSLPTVTDTYYPLTGLPDTQSTSAGTITAVYDALGRQTGYQDANANTTCYYYDIDSRLAATIDSKTDSSLTTPSSCPTSAPSGDATAYTYDNGNGALVAITDAPSGTAFYGSYDADGNLTSETLPNGMSQNTSFNETDTPTNETDLKFTSCVTACNWFTDTGQPTVHDQWATQASTLSSQNYSYDQDARLTQVQDTVLGGRADTTAALLTASAGPTSVITGPDGNVWVAEDWQSKIAKITPAGTVTEYSTGSGTGPMDLTVGPDGNIWFTGAQGSMIGKITTSGTVTPYALPANSYPTSIARGKGNTLVYTDYWSGKVGVITTSGSYTQYQPPTTYAAPANIVQGSDGNDYFEEYNSSTHLEQIAEFNTSTDAITETALKSGSAPDQEWDSGPGEAAAGQGVVWFVDDGNQDIVEYNIANQTASYFPFPSGTTMVEGLTLAKDGTLWFTEATTGRIGQLNPATGTIAEYTTSPASASSTGITQGPDGNIWFADNTNNDLYTVNANSTAYTPTAAGTCTTRQYAFDADTNRTGLTTITSANQTCNTSGGTTQNYTFDSADRLTASGSATPTYDPFGRITNLPASLADPAGQNALTSAFYLNDRIQQLNQGNQTISYTLDPALRIQQRTTVNGSSTTYEDSYYDGASDSPAWTQDVNSNGQPIANTWRRDIAGLDGNLEAIQVASGSGTSTALQLEDLHADVVETAATNPNASTPLTACDATEYGVPRTGVGKCSGASRYSWLGGKARPTELASGVIAMGRRAYAPTLGWFLQPDPLPGADANSYGYANGDPVNQSDLDGDSARSRIKDTAKNVHRCALALVLACGLGGGPLTVPEPTTVPTAVAGGQAQTDQPDEPQIPSEQPVREPPVGSTSSVRGPAPQDPTKITANQGGHSGWDSFWGWLGVAAGTVAVVCSQYCPVLVVAVG